MGSRGAVFNIFFLCFCSWTINAVQSRGYSGHKLRRLRRKLAAGIRHGGSRSRVGRRTGACIIYMPTRTETDNLAAYFRRRGVKSMAYHSQVETTYRDDSEMVASPNP